MKPYYIFNKACSLIQGPVDRDPPYRPHPAPQAFEIEKYIIKRREWEKYADALGSISIRGDLVDAWHDEKKVYEGKDFVILKRCIRNCEDEKILGLCEHCQHIGCAMPLNTENWISASDRLPGAGAQVLMKWTDGEKTWKGDILAELHDIIPNQYHMLQWYDNSNENTLQLFMFSRYCSQTGWKAVGTIRYGMWENVETKEVINNEELLKIYKQQSPKSKA